MHEISNRNYLDNYLDNYCAAVGYLSLFLTHNTITNRELENFMLLSPTILMSDIIGNGSKK